MNFFLHLIFSMSKGAIITKLTTASFGPKFTHLLDWLWSNENFFQYLSLELLFITHFKDTFPLSYLFICPIYITIIVEKLRIVGFWWRWKWKKVERRRCWSWCKAQDIRKRAAKARWGKERNNSLLIIVFEG